MTVALAPVVLNGFAHLRPLTVLERCAEMLFERGEWEYRYLTKLCAERPRYVLLIHENARQAVRVWMLAEQVERMKFLKGEHDARDSKDGREHNLCGVAERTG